MSRSGGPQIKNRAPAAIQITAEQLLREARERGLDDAPKVPKQFITDKEELLQYQQTKRKDFEDQIRRQRQHIGIWCKYGLWESSQKEFERARSVFERALDVDYRNQTLWLKYAEMEMKNKFINHARNVWDRAVTLHPRVDSFWFKYSYMEEMVSAVDNARQIFERWMKWEPDDLAWAAYIKFEMRQGQVDRARDIYDKYVLQLPTARAYIKYASWEEKNHEFLRSRGVFERALSELHPQERTEKLLLNFARFEERCKEFERARVIFQYALGQLGDSTSISPSEEFMSELKKEYIAFEKRHGSKALIEDCIISQRRKAYVDKISADKFDYDTWFDYIRLEEAEPDNFDRIRAVYQEAVLSVPPVKEKRFWRRYIYIWINYALFEELTARDVPAARSVYQRCLAVLPHSRPYAFTFGKIWLMAAHLEVRQKDLVAARKILGTAIGMCPGKENLLKGYISLEQQLGEVDRCRKIYAKYIEQLPHCSTAWVQFAQMEVSVGEITRARSIFELGLSQQEAGCEMDMPELVWKAYIDMEASEGQNTHVRKLYERLLDKTGHFKVWISFAMFESELPDRKAAEFDEEPTSEDEGVSDSAVEASRTVFSRGYDALKRAGLKEERMLLLEAWRDMEEKALDRAGGDPGMLQAVDAKMPRKIKMRREKEGGFMEEFFDYIFPDDEKKMVGLKILEKAMAWKKLAGALPNPNLNPNAEELSIDDDDEDNDNNKAEAEVEVDVDEMVDGNSESAGEVEQQEQVEEGVPTLGKRKADF